MKTSALGRRAVEPQARPAVEVIRRALATQTQKPEQERRPRVLAGGTVAR